MSLNLANEAGYLYTHSKELVRINKKLRLLSKKAEKQVNKYHKAKTEDKKHKHKKNHTKTSTTIKKLVKKHDKLITLLRHHHVAYQHALHKEHKVK